MEEIKCKRKRPVSKSMKTKQCGYIKTDQISPKRGIPRHDAGKHGYAAVLMDIIYTYSLIVLFLFYHLLRVCDCYEAAGGIMVGGWQLAARIA